MLLFLQLLNNRRRVPVAASWHRRKRPDRMGSLGERRCVNLHRTRNADLDIYSTSTHQDIHLDSVLICTYRMYVKCAYTSLHTSYWQWRRSTPCRSTDWCMVCTYASHVFTNRVAL